MKKSIKLQDGTMMLLLLIVLFSLSVVIASYDRDPKIEIISYLVRDRVIPLGEINVDSIMIVGFKFPPRTRPSSNMRVHGELFFNDQLISQDEIVHPDPQGGNLGFQFSLYNRPVYENQPLSLPDGTFLITIRLVDEHDTPIVSVEQKLNSNQLSRLFGGFGRTYPGSEYVDVSNQTKNSNDQETDGSINSSAHADFLVFQKSYLDRVYPDTRPNRFELMAEIKASVSKGETKPITFSIRAKKDLGMVSVEASPLSGASGTLDKNCLQIGSVGQLTETVDRKKKGNRVDYRWAPKIIQQYAVSVPKGISQRYWLTLKIPPHARSGEYKSTVTIDPEFGHSTDIPMVVTVLPLRLTDTDIQYGMMMTYPFYELDSENWSKEERSTIRNSGMAICRDMRNHGMTMLYPHSHFYYQKGKSGEPLLSSLEASLDAYAAFDFPGPFCWYLGHLVQTSKVFHPGSILNYDEGLAKMRLHQLLEAYSQMARQRGIPREKLIVQTVDEPDREDRIAAGKNLNRIARDMGFKTLITRRWPEVDIICTLAPSSDKRAKQIRHLAKTWWIYPNDALTGKNRAYTRYVFGFGAWRWGVDGVVPWTFQMTEGANGNPFTVLDGDEVMVAYPGIDGPIPTPLWETIRDGINDYKYIYQLKMLIADGKAAGKRKAFEIEKQLNQLKDEFNHGSLAQEGQYGDWFPATFDAVRGKIGKWAVELNSGSVRDEK